MNLTFFCSRPLRGRTFDPGVTDPGYSRKHKEKTGFQFIRRSNEHRGTVKASISEIKARVLHLFQDRMENRLFFNLSACDGGFQARLASGRNLDGR